jgi:hypothetical protein
MEILSDITGRDRKRSPKELGTDDLKVQIELVRKLKEEFKCRRAALDIILLSA